MISLCSWSFDIILEYRCIKIMIYNVTFANIFCKITIIWPNFDVKAIFRYAL